MAPRHNAVPAHRSRFICPGDVLLPQTKRDTTMAYNRAVAIAEAGHSRPLRRVALINQLSFNDTMWNLMYGATINQLGLSPTNFQLIYPFVGWDWPVTPTGYISSQQYDFCSTMPEWSAVGQYTSSGARFNDAYGEFLSTILATTSNPTLQQKINNAGNQLQLATNNYNTIYSQAQNAYTAAVPSGNPTMTAWLASPAGAGWNSQINSALLDMSTAQGVYTTLVGEANTPGLTQALQAYTPPSSGNQNPFYAKLQDPGTSGFPPVPNYQVASNPTTWLQKVQGGGATPGSVQFNMGQSTYNYSNTWAQTSSSADFFFFSVSQNSSWQQIQQFQSAQSLSVNIQFKAWETIGIQPAGWYTSTAPKFYKNGPFTPGYCGEPDNSGDTAAFGASGYMNVFKTGMIVAYQPTIVITTDSSTFNSVQTFWNSSSGISVGPFFFGSGNQSGGQTYNASSSSSSNQLIVSGTGNDPVIIGITVDILP
jgi:hypothetical protein